MKCQILLSNKNNTSKCCLLKLLPSMQSVKGNGYISKRNNSGMEISFFVLSGGYFKRKEKQMLSCMSTSAPPPILGQFQILEREATAYLQKLSPFAKW